jgi:hypothetical protein
MTETQSLLKAADRRVLADAHHLTATFRRWLTSGALIAPHPVVRALDVLGSDLQLFEGRARRLKLRHAGDRRARTLFIESCRNGALGVQVLRLAASDPNPEVRAKRGCAGYPLAEEGGEAAPRGA